jgi:hypothetical protein
VSFDPNREGCASGQHLVDDIQDHLRTTRFMNVDIDSHQLQPRIDGIVDDEG